VNFDIRTAMLLAVAGIVSLSLLLLWYAPGKDAVGRRAYRTWSVAIAMTAGSIVVLALRVVLPEWICVLFGNGLLMVSIARLQRSLEVLADPPPPAWHHLVVVGCAWLTIIPFTLIWPSIHARVIVISLGLAGSLAFLSYRISRVPSLWAHRSARALMLVALVGVMILVSRAILESLGVEPKLDYYTSTSIDVISYTYYGVGPLLLTLAFLMLLNDRAFAELERQAALDPLTGIFNRRNFERQARRLLTSAAQHQQNLALLLIDADHFKSVNDQYGHQVGDEALRAIVRALQSELRSEDVLARHGGEEFVVLLKAQDVATACSIAERLRAAVANAEFMQAGVKVPLRVSIGIAFTGVQPQQLTSSLQHLIRSADTALYDAKREGRNRCKLAA
jgi:diguanylate cyclase (GGDEF)-like protein